MNKYKKLINNSFVFAIGNLGSKLMQFIMIPLYSYTLSTSDFGKVDVLTTVISLLSLVVCLDISDAVFRFALDKAENKSQIFSLGFWLIAVASLISFIIAVFLNRFISGYPIIITSILLSATMFNSLISNFARAIGFVKQFAVAGIINTFVMGLLNIILLVFLKMAMTGYIVSMILGLIIASLYLLFKCKLHSYIIIGSLNKNLFKRMCKYGLPLIPNGLAWWLNSASDRIFIVLMLGASPNGIYAMANKIPNVLSVLTNIFFQSWQISAVEEYKGKNGKIFITNVFGSFLSFMFMIGVIFLAIIKPMFRLILSPSYYNGWKLTPFLILAIIYASISSFLGTIYTATKKTFPVFLTTVVGAIVNIIATVVLIHIMGIYGAAIANIISFFIVSILRLRDILKINKISVDLKQVIFLHVVYLLATMLVLSIKNTLISFSVIIILVFIQLLCDKKSKRILMVLLQKIISLREKKIGRF